ncbi:MAG: hypothetical protein JSV18_00375 [Candidatus Bathyarchaeota archaeon]|nr:MAG: hypothetical protein JSV18_00375 [Candidatus Bathyarchaeota archaeon]
MDLVKVVDFQTDELLKKGQEEEITIELRETPEFEESSFPKAEHGGEGTLNPEIHDVMESLVKSLSMQLWSVDMLQEGKVNEKHFNRLYASYSIRLKPCLGRRNEMLEFARDLEPLETKLDDAKVRIEELEMRRAIKDVTDEEYRVKIPALKWDIKHYEEGLTKRWAEINFLEDLKSVASEEEINELKVKAEKCIEAMNSEDSPWKGSPETTEKVKEALEDIKACFEGFGYTLSE